MPAMRRVILTNLLLFILTTQQKVTSDVILIDKAKDITCRKPGKENICVWYPCDGTYFQWSNTSKACADKPGGRIFTCMDENTDCALLQPMNCTSQKIFVNTSITGNYVKKPESITKRIGQNVTFKSKFQDSGSYILLWIMKRQNISKCLYSVEVTRESVDFGFTLNRLCCSTNDTNQEERIQLRNQSALRENPQHFLLDLVNLTSSDSGEYINIRYTWDNGRMKWKQLNRYLLNVPEDEDTKPTPETPFTESLHYIIAGSVGGFIAVLAILLLSLFFIKQRGKHKKMTRSSPVSLPDDYECTPYAVSEHRKEIPNVIYSLAQNVVPTMDSEYSEVQLSNGTTSGAHGCESVAKENIVPDAEYAVIMKNMNE